MDKKVNQTVLDATKDLRVTNKKLKEVNQYGNNGKVLVLSLINEGCVSFYHTRNLIRGFSNDEIDMSEVYLVKLQKNVQIN